MAVQHIHRVASRIACNGIIIITSTQQIMHTPNHFLIQIERINAEHNNLSAMVRWQRLLIFLNALACYARHNYLFLYNYIKSHFSFAFSMVRYSYLIRSETKQSL